jgi:adenylate cyclase
VGVEIERKFRVRDDSWRAGVRLTERLRQGYLAQNATCSVRVRVEGERGRINVKGVVIGTTRPEFEYPLPVEDARTLLATLCQQPLIEKDRHHVPHEGHRWEIDEFLGQNAGLVIAELELSHADEPFRRPPWLGTEVTDDRRFYNSSLVNYAWSQLRRELGE